MRLVINIPCYNEEATLPLVLNELPKTLAGIETIEVQVIDDGSTDRTAEIARLAGCRVIRHKQNLGLGVAFKHGIDAALAAGADIMVNTDADNQYPSRYIEALVQPVLNGGADLVIGDRQTWRVAHFSPLKKALQWFGSSLVRTLTGTTVMDTVSGFRAYSRESLLRINILTRFSYVLDTIMQCAKKNLVIAEIPIEVNPPTRASRLFTSMFQHVRKSGLNLLRLYVVYRPFMTFCVFALCFLLPAALLVGRFLYFFATTSGNTGHTQSLVAAAILAISGVMMLVLGIVGHLLKTNRDLIEEQLYHAKKRHYDHA
jgi:glycosyltransferase involved in cell wall biosynthesis